MCSSVQKQPETAESWCGLTEKETRDLEKVDEELIRKILQAHSKTALELLYLELGLIPVRFVIQQKRIGYLHYLLQQEEDSLLGGYLDAQVRYPVRGDWVLLVKEDLESLGLNLTFDNIARMSQNDLKNRVKMAVNSKAYTYLTEMQQKHSKSKNLVYSELKLQDYLCSVRSAMSICDKYKARLSDA